MHGCFAEPLAGPPGPYRPYRPIPNRYKLTSHLLRRSKHLSQQDLRNDFRFRAVNTTGNNLQPHHCSLFCSRTFWAAPLCSRRFGWWESAVKPWKTRLESREMFPISTGLGVWMFLHPLCPCKQLPDVVQVQTCEACISCSRRDRSLYHFDPANVYSNRYRS